MATKSGLGPLSQNTTIDMGGVKYKLKAGEVAELTITEAKPDKIDVERLAADREYWDKLNAPEGAEYYIPEQPGECAAWIRSSEDGYALFDCMIIGTSNWVADPSATGQQDLFIPRPPEDREVECDEWSLPKKAIMVNPHETPLYYGQDHLGEEIEAIGYLADEYCYVVRFEWGLGVLHESNVDFVLYLKRSKEQREREELKELVSTEFVDWASEHLGGLDKALDALMVAKYREP